MGLGCREQLLKKLNLAREKCHSKVIGRYECISFFLFFFGGENPT